MKNELKVVPVKDFEEKILKAKVEPDSFLKKWLITYVGEQFDPEDCLVTVEMVIETFRKEFPQALLAVAEQNFIRGYSQASVDFEDAEKIEKMKEGAYTQGYNQAVIDMGQERARRYKELMEEKLNEQSNKKTTTKKNTK